MYLGDFRLDQTVYVPFDTYDSNGASVTLTGLLVTDIEIYKDGSVTQRASDNGFTLLDTDGIDFDGAVGHHGFSIDLSDNSDAGFYVAGSDYVVLVNSVTVDSQTVRFHRHFSIQNRGDSINKYHPDGVLDVSAAGATTCTLGGTRAGSSTSGRYDGLTGIVVAGTGAGEFFVAAAAPDGTTYNGGSTVLTYAVAPSTQLDATSDIMFLNQYQGTVTFPTNFGSLGIESDGDLTKVNTLDGHTAQTGDNFVKVNQLTFTKANEVDSNVQSANDTAVGGTGAVGDRWGPA